MRKENEFLIYCIEIYKNAKSMNGKEVFNLFKKYNVLDYIRKFYPSLHTTGEKYIINDIDEYIENYKNKRYSCSALA